MEDWFIKCKIGQSILQYESRLDQQQGVQQYINCSKWCHQRSHLALHRRFQKEVITSKFKSLHDPHSQTIRQKSMNQTQQVALIEAQNALISQSLENFTVCSIYRSPKRPICASYTWFYNELISSSFLNSDLFGDFHEGLLCKFSCFSVHTPVRDDWQLKGCVCCC